MAEMYEKRKKRFMKRYKKGFCLWCGKNKRDADMKSCSPCREKREVIYGRWKERNRGKFLESRRRWYQENRESVCEYQRKHTPIYRLRIKKEVLKAYGGKCACCGETELWFLTLDHIKGGGSKHRSRLGVKSSVLFYLRLRKMGYPKGIQVLCWNCNLAKFHLGTCPHQNKKRHG